LVAGLFFGLSFGMAGVGAAALGRLADATSIDYVYQVCSSLPLIGLLTVLLPNLGRPVPPTRERIQSGTLSTPGEEIRVTSPVAGSITMRGGGISR